MIFPLICALHYGEAEWFAFLFAMLITAVCAFLGYYALDSVD